MAPAALSRITRPDLLRAISPRTVASIAVAVSAVLRLLMLDALPPFIDEASYVRWAARLAESPSADTLWISTHEDWKTPGFIWALAVAYGWMDDPIQTSRLITSLSGVVTVALVYHAGLRLLGAWPGAIAAAVIAVSPAVVFADRLAMTDAPIVTLTALTWGLSIGAAKGNVPCAVGTGCAVALALWIKLSGALLLIIPVAGIVLVSQASLRRRAASLALCAAPASIACMAFLLAPKSAEALQYAGYFVLPPEQLATVPVTQWAENLTQMGGWALAYLPSASIVAAIGALALPFVTRRREDWWLWSVLVFWLAFHAFLGATLYSRYVLPALIPLALLTARVIVEVGRALRDANRDRLASICMVGASLAVVLSLAIPAMLLVVAPTRAALPRDDRAQYIEQWSAGFGQAEALQWIADTTAAEPGPAIVLTNHVLGAPRDLAALTFRNRADLDVHVENRIRHPYGGVADAWRGHGVPVYALINGNQDDGEKFLRLNPEFTTVAAFERPGAKTVVSVLEFRPR